MFNGINDDNMMMEVIWEFTTEKKTSKITSEQVLVWARKVEVQRNSTLGSHKRQLKVWCHKKHEQKDNTF